LHRIEQRFIPKTSCATVRRAMTQHVTLETLTRDPLLHVKVAQLCRRCDIGAKCLRCHATPPTFLIWNNLCDLVEQPPAKTYLTAVVVGMQEVRFRWPNRACLLGVW